MAAGWNYFMLLGQYIVIAIMEYQTATANSRSDNHDWFRRQ
jgi:hypothetical protein